MWREIVDGIEAEPGRIVHQEPGRREAIEPGQHLSSYVRVREVRRDDTGIANLVSQPLGISPRSVAVNQHMPARAGEKTAKLGADAASAASHDRRTRPAELASHAYHR